jgi:endo-beta-N-acetylglucosaminidase D
MGDIGQIDSIAEELKSRSDGLTDVCDQFIQLAEEFDFDGILKLADELEGNV